MNKHGDKRVLFQVALKNVRPLNFHITARFFITPAHLYFLPSS